MYCVCVWSFCTIMFRVYSKEAENHNNVTNVHVQMCAKTQADTHPLIRAPHTPAHARTHTWKDAAVSKALPRSGAKRGRGEGLGAGPRWRDWMVAGAKPHSTTTATEEEELKDGRVAREGHRKWWGGWWWWRGRGVCCLSLEAFCVASVQKDARSRRSGAAKASGWKTQTHKQTWYSKVRKERRCERLKRLEGPTEGRSGLFHLFLTSVFNWLISCANAYKE